MIREAYRQKYQTFANELEAELGDVDVKPHKPKGGMFLWANMKMVVIRAGWKRR